MTLTVTSGGIALWASSSSLRALLSDTLDHHVASSSVTGSAGVSPPLLHAESKPKPAKNAPGTNIDLMCFFLPAESLLDGGLSKLRFHELYIPSYDGSKTTLNKDHRHKE